ncbi:ferric uptake regulator family protein [Rhodospirillum rubrum F11]|uniref:Ferric uptake regulator (FUR) family n=2 Tax=Rhodospirillum rubrum TaxID=1085 RepID=Q2RT34_RHORT|nr:Fur family transcriptional regulator [Rhodospirillum rubrum]ABC22711.1 Ferric uptake regulator (FUR) family [Rhodospirillum rubrum ATCC 11170]AEO48430.1 ferric uptake regulator family protein [Rhodospirillum rubrum F11]MBK5954309.1 transcriptional repressor [Rhodospirillum rubrum]QXG78703.1 transcriptional repressor [Rhodospirillum rubrum]
MTAASNDPSPSPFAPARPAEDHDHGACLRRGLAEAEAHCLDLGARLTAARRRVLDVLLREGGHGALGAYEIIDRMAARGDARPAPMSVYRALEFLIEVGLAHRISSLNAFVACAHPRRNHGAQFLVCRSCHAVIEIDDQECDDTLGRALDAAAQAAGFLAEAPVVEVPGLCRRCREG